MKDANIPLSLLDLAPITEGHTWLTLSTTACVWPERLKTPVIIASGWPNITIWWISPAPPQR